MKGFLILERLHILFTVQTVRRTSMRVWESALCRRSDIARQRTAEEIVNIFILNERSEACFFPPCFLNKVISVTFKGEAKSHVEAFFSFTKEDKQFTEAEKEGMRGRGREREDETEREREGRRERESQEFREQTQGQEVSTVFLMGLFTFCPLLRENSHTIYLMSTLKECTSLLG